MSAMHALSKWNSIQKGPHEAMERVKEWQEKKNHTTQNTSEHTLNHFDLDVKNSMQ